VARFWPVKAVAVGAEAARAARQCEDAYKRVSVRAWEIAALAEVGAASDAARALEEALADSRKVLPTASKGETLILLLQAAVRIGSKESDLVYRQLGQECSGDSHWRSKRALRDAVSIRSGKLQSRQFF